MAKYTEIDDAVDQWFGQIRSISKRWKPIPVSKAIIQTRARLEAKKLGISDFSASDGWFRNWTKRKNIGKNVNLRGEAGGIDLKKTEDMLKELRFKLSEFKQDHIYNMDETGLFFRALPTRSYIISPEDSRQTARGTRSLTSKDRITLLLCVNAKGVLNSSPLMVGKSIRPTCFRGAMVPIRYINQENSWCDKSICAFWWEKIFLPHVRMNHKESVALIMDNFNGHNIDFYDPENQVTVFYLPPNSTSITQPLDQGIIATFKMSYRYSLLEKLVEAFENYETLQVSKSVYMYVYIYTNHFKNCISGSST